MAKICNIRYFDISISDRKSGALEINQSEDSIEPFGYESSSQFDAGLFHAMDIAKPLQHSVFDIEKKVDQLGGETNQQ